MQQLTPLTLNDSLTARPRWFPQQGLSQVTTGTRLGAGNALLTSWSVKQSVSKQMNLEPCTPGQQPAGSASCICTLHSISAMAGVLSKMMGYSTEDTVHPEILCFIRYEIVYCNTLSRLPSHTCSAFHVLRYFSNCW